MYLLVEVGLYDTKESMGLVGSVETLGLETDRDALCRVLLGRAVEELVSKVVHESYGRVMEPEEATTDARD